MNKKLIAAAVVAGLAAPMAAQADVSVYGVAQLELTNYDDGAATTGIVLDDKFGQSRVGVRWSEDLGGGLKSLGVFEWGPQIDSHFAGGSNPALDGRIAYIGLKGGWGEVDAGTILQPYKYSGGVKYDAFVATAAQARPTSAAPGAGGGMSGGAFGHGAYFNDAISYKNKFGMATIWLAYSPEKAATIGTPSGNGASGDLMASVVVGFNGGEAGLAYAKDNNASGTTGADGVKNTKIFGKYSFGSSTVLAQYEDSKAATSGNKTKYAFLGYQLKMGMNKFVLQLGQTKPDGGNKTNYGAAGVIHNFSKKTRVFLAYRNTKTDGSDANKSLSLGLTEKF